MVHDLAVVQDPSSFGHLSGPLLSRIERTGFSEAEMAKMMILGPIQFGKCYCEFFVRVFSACSLDQQGRGRGGLWGTDKPELLV